MLQLNPPIPVILVEGFGWPTGKGACIGWIDYSIEHFTLWKVAMDSDGAIWDVPQSHVRLQSNPSAGREVAPPEEPESMQEIRRRYERHVADHARQAAQKLVRWTAIFKDGRRQVDLLPEGVDPNDSAEPHHPTWVKFDDS